ncbi:hypothetical protein [Paludibacterium purpuratum]|uniref:Uncharacterized protein n=1 Tax=Paludibacterium purpuratum TaxID=1144873 RepID=A0A4V3DUM3_9NEIS|nr:hypothetical protein [Paludibacterium purpuratum]TDR73910.1 hypothetical protein DFP86_112114 [Paludibacterium purpuratum]
MDIVPLALPTGASPGGIVAAPNGDIYVVDEGPVKDTGTNAFKAKVYKLPAGGAATDIETIDITLPPWGGTNSEARLRYIELQLDDKSEVEKIWLADNGQNPKGSSRLYWCDPDGDNVGSVLGPDLFSFPLSMLWDSDAQCIWFLSQSGSAGKVSSVKADGNAATKLADLPDSAGSVALVRRASDKTLWIPSPGNNCVYQVKTENPNIGQLTTIPLAPNIIGHQGFRSALFNNAQDILFVGSTQTGTLFSIDLGKSPRQIESVQRLPDSDDIGIYGMQRDRADYIWLSVAGRRTGRLYRLPPNGQGITETSAAQDADLYLMGYVSGGNLDQVIVVDQKSGSKKLLQAQPSSSPVDPDVSGYTASAEPPSGVQLPGSMFPEFTVSVLKGDSSQADEGKTFDLNIIVPNGKQGVALFTDGDGIGQTHLAAVTDAQGQFTVSTLQAGSNGMDYDRFQIQLLYAGRVVDSAVYQGTIGDPDSLLPIIEIYKGNNKFFAWAGKQFGIGTPTIRLMKDGNPDPSYPDKIQFTLTGPAGFHDDGTQQTLTEGVSAPDATAQVDVYASRTAAPGAAVTLTAALETNPSAGPVSFTLTVTPTPAHALADPDHWQMPSGNDFNSDSFAIKVTGAGDEVCEGVAVQCFMDDDNGNFAFVTVPPSGEDKDNQYSITLVTNGEGEAVLLNDQAKAKYCIYQLSQRAAEQNVSFIVNGTPLSGTVRVLPGVTR